MYALYHKKTKQYLVYNGKFSWDWDKKRAITFDNKSSAIDFYTFTFCPHFMTIRDGSLQHIISETTIICLDGEDDLSKAYDRAMGVI